MPTEDSLKAAKEAVSAIGEVIKIAGENPDAKAAGRDLAKAARTITSAINVCLLPIAAVNYGYEKARIYFHSRFQEDLERATANIPPENLIDPKASLAGPVLQGLAFSHEEDDLKRLYLHLLATAMDSRAASTAHPSFVEIIKQLTAEEATLLKSTLAYPALIPIVELRLVKAGEGYRSVLKHVLDLRNSITRAIEENVNLPAMVDNWIRLRLVHVDYAMWVMGDQRYEWVSHRPEMIRARGEPLDPGVSVEFGRGSMQRTDYGRQFAESVGIITRTPGCLGADLRPPAGPSPTAL